MRVLVTLFIALLVIVATIELGFVAAKPKYRQGTPPMIIEELGKDENCTNAVYNVSQGTIKFPHSNSGEGPGSHCRYSFNISQNENGTVLPVIFLNVRALILSQEDHLVIFDGMTIRNYSGQIEPFILMIERGDKPYISLNVSINNDVQRKLDIMYSAEACRITYQMGPPVKIISPIYTKKAHQTFNCTWIITATSAYQVYLQFTKFHITAGQVVVKSGPTTSTNYSGTELPDDVMSTQPNIHIFMEVSTENDDQMFSAVYSFPDKACSSIKEITGSNAIIRYPGEASSLRVTCINVLTVADPRMRIAGSIEGNSTTDSYAMVIVDDGNAHSQNLAMHATGAEFASYFVTSGPKLVIFYNQIGIGASSSVNLTVQSGGGIYRPGIVEITKPANDQEQSTLYSLIAAKDNLARLSPIGPLPNNCTIDVYGKDKIKLLARFSKSTVYETLSDSDGIILDVQNFHGDNFKFNFTEVLNECSGFGSSEHGNFHINNQKDYVGPCVYTIRPSVYQESDSISLHVLGANLEKSDRITIYENGKQIFQWNHTDFINGNKLIYGDVVSGLVVQFEPDKNRTQSTGSVVFLYYNLKSDCGGIITITNSTTITSPRYPNMYPLNANCNWTLVAPENKTLLLSFSKISLSYNESLKALEQIDGNETVLFSFTTNNIYPDDIVTSGNRTSVIFTSPPENHFSSKTDYGFVLEAQVLDCGGHVKTDSGMNSTPNFPTALNKSTFCAWIFEVPETSSANVHQIIDYTFHMESSSNRTNGTLTFHDGGSTTSPALSLTETLTGRNKLLVTYKYVNDTKGGAAFQVVYKTAGCTAQCLNGICLRNEWRCNRIDDCGDNSDEIDCPYNPAPVYNGVAVPTFVVVLFVMLAIGAAGGYFAPIVIHRIKNPRHYQEFRPTIGDE